VAADVRDVVSIPEEFHDLFEKRTFAHLSTLTPHSTPVWPDYDADADRVLANTARGRHKERNVRRDPSVEIARATPTTPTGTSPSRGWWRT